MGESADSNKAGGLANLDVFVAVFGEGEPDFVSPFDVVAFEASVAAFDHEVAVIAGLLDTVGVLGDRGEGRFLVEEDPDIFRPGDSVGEILQPVFFALLAEDALFVGHIFASLGLAVEGFGLAVELRSGDLGFHVGNAESYDDVEEGWWHFGGGGFFLGHDITFFFLMGDPR